ncbi:MAG: hypothetical protein OEL89_01535 [Candidatus Peregrinibacteria bacterium]|nr:hypothetical protein [Candidatus Peregrinibacteria bacterium]
MTDETTPETTEEVTNTVTESSKNTEAGAKNGGSTLTAGEKTLSAIGYISFFCILPLVMKPTSKFCQHHGKQGLVLTLFFILLSWVTWMGGPIIHVLFSLIWVVLAILGIINAVQGVKWKMPLVEKIAGKLDFD